MIIKVIDLLVRIANENEIPEKIKYENYIWWYDKDWKDYKNAQVGFDSYLINTRYHKTDFLNDEVEIIEDAPSFNGFKVKDGGIIYKEDKKIEKLDLSDWWEITSSEDCKPEMLAKIFNKNAKAFSSKLNEIIEKVNGE